MSASLEGILPPEVVSQSAAISAALQRGEVVVVRDALPLELAERAHRSLIECRAWDPYVRQVQPFFSIASHVVAQPNFPPEVVECQQLFTSEETRRFMSRLTGLDCLGETMFDPTLYLPGDYLAPHSDAGGNRAITYLWQLTKDWRPEWGGHFFWCSPMTSLVPTFNTLVFFQATADGYHGVTPVTSFATGKRLTINGWWLSTSPTAEQNDDRRGWYRGPLAPLADAPSSRILTIPSSPVANRHADGRDQ